MDAIPSTDECEMITCPCCGLVSHEDDVLGYPVIIPGRIHTWQLHCPECTEPIGAVYSA
jgi:hypothetical protein